MPDLVVFPISEIAANVRLISRGVVAGCCSAAGCLERDGYSTIARYPISTSLIGCDLFGKPRVTCPDHAATAATESRTAARRWHQLKGHDETAVRVIPHQ